MLSVQREVKQAAYGLVGLFGGQSLFLECVQQRSVGVLVLLILYARVGRGCAAADTDCSAITRELAWARAGAGDATDDGAAEPAGAESATGSPFLAVYDERAFTGNLAWLVRLRALSVIRGEQREVVRRDRQSLAELRGDRHLENHHTGAGVLADYARCLVPGDVGDSGDFDEV